MQLLTNADELCLLLIALRKMQQITKPSTELTQEEAARAVQLLGDIEELLINNGHHGKLADAKARIL